MIYLTLMNDYNPLKAVILLFNVLNSIHLKRYLIFYLFYPVFLQEEFEVSIVEFGKKKIFLIHGSHLVFYFDMDIYRK